jgi:hypothetical protein
MASYRGSHRARPRDLLVPYPAEPITMWPISRRVNSPAIDNPDPLMPVSTSSCSFLFQTCYTIDISGVQRAQLVLIDLLEQKGLVGRQEYADALQVWLDNVLPQERGAARMTHFTP